MPRFGKRSKERLETCEEPLQILFNEVIKDFDCTVLVGHRGEEDQNRAFAEVKSKAKWGESKHNSFPSKAIDIVPYPIDWDDRDRYHFFAGFVMSVAIQLGINIRWGGNWANDFNTGFIKNRFDDLVHFELI